MAVPFLPTATAAAAFAIRNAVFPIGARRERHRQHRSDGVARAGDVAHLDRMRRHMDGLALARHQRHAVLALRHQHGLAIRELHRVLRGRQRCSCSVSARLRVASANSLRLGVSSVAPR